MQLKPFFKQVFTIAVAFLLSILALSFIVLYGITKVTSTGSTHVGNNSVLTFNMRGNLVEFIPSSLFGSKKGTINAKLVTDSIYQAAKDHRIRAIYLDCAYLNVAWGGLEEIREALLFFKEQGKTVVAYGDYFSQKAYYLASVANEIFLSPGGTLDFKGFSATIYFYTKLFEKLSIQPLIFRIGSCKDAVEPFCLTQMSEESKQQREAYVHSLYDHFLNKISASRDVPISELRQHADHLSAVQSDDALGARLITRIGYETDAKKLLDDALKSPTLVTSSRYMHLDRPPDLANKIGVLIAEGEIVPGSNSSGYIGAHEVVKTLKAIEKDPDIKALVLRINSPGGSALDSDIIWKTIEEVKAIKPVVASMSGVAASGGYYIAAPCNYIFAQPTTITGSIGIFGLLFDPSALMGKIGIDSDVVKTAPSADFLSPRMHVSDAESKFIYKHLRHSYNQFLQKVASGRSLSLEVVESLAGGRVYTGLAARDNGLVDELGGLQAAIAKAASLAKLTDKYSIAYLPRPKTKIEQVLNYTRDYSKEELFNSLLQEHPLLHHLTRLSAYRVLPKPWVVQAMLPYTLSVD